MKIGALFAGYCGLEMAVQSVMGGETAWVSDIDPGACKILAHHWPDIPNLGDITKIRWADQDAVEVMCGGFPCQPVSHAGLRLGDQDERWLWDEFARAIGALRPPYVVLENVRGLLSAGRGRLFGQVLADLAAERYDARWRLVRAADVGAPHGRARIFVLAEDTDRATRGERWQPAPRQAQDGRAWSDTGGRSRASAPDSTGDGRDERRTEPAGIVGRPDAAQRGATPTDAESGDARREQSLRRGRATGETGRERRDDTPADRVGDTGRVSDRERGATTDAYDRADDGQRARKESRQGSPASTYADGDGQQSLGRLKSIGRNPHGCDRADIAWGDYEPAIRRWEAVLGRPAPAPTEPGRTNPRLSPRFVEWLMGLPEGHVCDVPGLTRNAQLKALGNGVVPQQAAAALRWLLTEERAA